MAQVNIRIDDELKEKGDSLFKELGLSFSSAVSIFVSLAVRTKAIPFYVTAHEPENDCSIELADKDFVSGGLSLDSNIRPNKLFTAGIDIVVYKYVNSQYKHFLQKPDY